MGIRHALFFDTLFFHKMIADKTGNEIAVIPKDYLKNNIVTSPMAYDEKAQTQKKNYTRQMDYVRYRTIELLAGEITARHVEGAVAEAGVDYGDCSWVINAAFPDRTMFLYDTFQGFDRRDVAVEKENGFTTDDFFRSANYFRRESFHEPQDQMNFVRNRLPHPEMAYFRQGYFPETTSEETNKKFAFVSLDMDLYQPIRSGIEFFYPRMSKCGYIMIHDYNHREFLGIKKAVTECEKIFGPIAKVPIPDQGGTIVLCC